MIPLKKDNRTIIRVWKGSLIQGRVGHVSLETNNFYMSFWPSGKCGKNFVFEKRESFFPKKPIDDYKNENNQIPDVIICLYSLNQDKMNKKFKELKNNAISNLDQALDLGENKSELTTSKDKSNFFWSLLGRMIPGTIFFKTPIDSSQHNCVSFIMEIIKVGDSNGLFSSSTSSIAIPSPNWLAEQAVKAKEKELHYFPETDGTDDFVYKGRIFNLVEESSDNTIKIEEKETEVNVSTTSFLTLGGKKSCQ